MVRDEKSGALKAFNFDSLINEIPEIKKLKCKIEAKSFNEPIDSSNMQPNDWINIAQIIYDNYDKHDGFVVLHGSDTMAYTASALSFLLENLSKPVILTGSQLPIGEVRTDAKENLLTSIEIAAAKKIAERSYIDKNNIGIWGWSFGGHMSTNALLKGSDIFTTAIAVAPVTSWRFYDTVYTERFLRTPQENPGGYDDNSPVNYAEKLKGNYLLVHGTGDDNVHVQNSYRMINSLIEANKQFDMFIVPDRTHGIYKGKNTRLNLYTKMTNFIDENLNKKSDKSIEIKG